jgi:hypothetical protein
MVQALKVRGYHYRLPHALNAGHAGGNLHRVIRLRRRHPVEPIGHDAAARTIAIFGTRACDLGPSVLDRYHIVAKLNKALDEVRADEARRMNEAGAHRC